jgi:hypothetical protein
MTYRPLPLALTDLVLETRHKLWASGFWPVAVYNAAADLLTIRP